MASTDQPQAGPGSFDVEARYHLLADNSSDVVFEIDAGDRIRWVSPSVTRVLGWDPDQLVGREALGLVSPADADRLQAALGHRLDGVAVVDEFRLRRGDGSDSWVSGRFRDVLDADGLVVGRQVAVRDVEHEVVARQALSETEQRYRLLVDNSADVVFQASADATLQWVSPSVRELTGWDADEVVGRPLQDLVLPEDRAALEPIIEAVQRGERAAYEGRLATVHGHRWVGVTAGPLRDDAGLVIGAVGGVRDVHAKVEARLALARSERMFRLAMESAPTGMAIVDLDRRFTQVNAALCQMLGRDESWMLAHRVPDILEPDDGELDLRERAEILAGKSASATVERRLVCADGSRRWAEHSIGLLRDEAGIPVQYVSQFVDVTAARHAADRLRYEATHDTLTHLANRRDLFHRIGTMLGSPARAEGIALLFIDIDRLKPVNDTYGHAAGDELIVEIAQRISAQVRAADVVARFGGDEFVVALGGLTAPDAAEAVARKIQRALHEPVDVEGHEVHASVSIGVASAPIGEDPDQVLQRADAALYRAKRTGRARIAVFDPALDAEVLGVGEVRHATRVVGRTGSSRAADGGRADADGCGPSLVTEEYLQHLRFGDDWGAVRVARALRAGGASVEQILDGLVAEGQRRIGAEWLANACSIADEHVATTVSEQVQAAIVADAITTSGARGLGPRAPQVLVASAEGEPHTLPARMVADRLRLAGCRTVFLGEGESARLRELVHGWHPDVIVLSCTQAEHLVGLSRSLAAVAEAGCPVMIGGAAVTSAAVAARLGADAWGRHVDDVVTYALSRPVARPDRAAPGVEALPFRSDEQVRHLSGSAMRALLSHSVTVATLDTWALAEITECFEHLVRTAGAAIYVDAPEAFFAHVEWAAQFFGYRGEPPEVVAASLEDLAVTCEGDLPQVAALFRTAAEHLGAS